MGWSAIGAELCNMLGQLRCKRIFAECDTPVAISPCLCLTSFVVSVLLEVVRVTAKAVRQDKRRRQQHDASQGPVESETTHVDKP